MWLQRESNARPRAEITNFGILVEGHGTCPGVLVSAICQLLAMRPTIQRIKACNSCLSPKDVICNVAAGGSGCNLEWLSGMCGICSHCSILLHFMLSAWADGSYVQYFLQLQCLRQMVLHASRLPYSQGEKYFQNFNTAAGPNVC